MVPAPVEGRKVRGHRQTIAKVNRGRHLASSTFVGWLNVELSLPIFRLALAVFIPWRGADGWHPR